MNRFMCLMLTLVLCLGCLMTAEAGEIVINNGLTVQSPEQFLGIRPCNTIYSETDHYCYLYSGRGIDGSSGRDDWNKMDDYVNALVASGYYRILEHEQDDYPFVEEYWTLQYIGPETITNTFGVRMNTSQQAAIIVQSYLKNIYVWYSLDVITADLEETQRRLNTTIFVVNSHSGSGDCLSCAGSGKCNPCGGSGTERNLLAGTRTWLVQDCSYCAGSGKCNACYGSGR